MFIGLCLILTCFLFFSVNTLTKATFGVESFHFELRDYIPLLREAIAGAQVRNQTAGTETHRKCCLHAHFQVIIQPAFS